MTKRTNEEGDEQFDRAVKQIFFARFHAEVTPPLVFSEEQ